MRMGRKAIGRTFEVIGWLFINGKVPEYSKVVCSGYNEKYKEYLVKYNDHFGYARGLDLRLVKEDKKEDK